MFRDCFLPPPFQFPFWLERGRNLDGLVIGAVDGGHALDGHPRMLEVDVLPGDRPLQSQDSRLEHFPSTINAILYRI